MPSSDFDVWFANHLGQSQQAVERLLRDKTAVRFLIAWSMLETSCFNGFAKGNELRGHCHRLTVDEGFDPLSLLPILGHFHARYQDKQLHSNLMHRMEHPDIKYLLQVPVDSLSNFEKVFFLVSVVYRYRNNIFHGSKGVASWLEFRPQIERCTEVMQALIAHASERPQREVPNVTETIMEGGVD